MIFIATVHHINESGRSFTLLCLCSGLWMKGEVRGGTTHSSGASPGNLQLPKKPAKRIAVGQHDAVGDAGHHPTIIGAASSKRYSQSSHYGLTVCGGEMRPVISATARHARAPRVSFS